MTVSLDSLYQEIILDHYKHPRRRGLREPFDAESHHVNPTCGDEVTVRVVIDATDGAPRVVDVSYEGQGCSISQASTSVLTELVVGKTVAEALAVQAQFLRLMQSKGEVEPDEEVLEDAVAFAGVARYPSRIKCALLGWMAWKDATAQAVGLTAGANDQVEVRRDHAGD
jgi:nitrogen fixation NifU-like protein